MSTVVIRAEKLSKVYQVGQVAPYVALRDVLAGILAAPARLFGKKSQRRSAASADLWALKDVSFEVRQGEVVGIIGRNGAGKSTLLKLLARVTRPTYGCAEVHGRMGTLLEVGTGFHSELTGRENVFLSGAILGMTKMEIQRSFDEIVAFAEVEKFIDTPVKHYSSGMYMRLAFAVAAHLDPEILIVDEVLAVGDLEFQRKCLGKMKDVSRGGRTILFVSHNMAAVQNLCTRAIVLQKGKVLRDDDPAAAIAVYSASGGAIGQTWTRPDANRHDAPIIFRSMSVKLLGEQPGHQIQITAELESLRPHAPAYVAIDILDGTSVAIMQAIPSLSPILPYEPGPRQIEVTIDLPPLIPDKYEVTAWVGQHNTVTYDLVHSVLSFEVLTSPTFGRTFPHTRDHGCLVPYSSVKCLSRTMDELAAECSR